MKTSGLDRVRLWSEFDDWEPAVATDPTCDYIYLLATRYDGPPTCPDCQQPAIIFRRSADGGATWEPDRFLIPTGGDSCQFPLAFVRAAPDGNRRASARRPVNGPWAAVSEAGQPGALRPARALHYCSQPFDEFAEDHRCCPPDLMAVYQEERHRHVQAA